MLYERLWCINKKVVMEKFQEMTQISWKYLIEGILQNLFKDSHSYFQSYSHNLCINFLLARQIWKWYEWIVFSSFNSRHKEMNCQIIACKCQNKHKTRPQNVKSNHYTKNYLSLINDNNLITAKYVLEIYRNIKSNYILLVKTLVLFVNMNIFRR